MSLDIDSVRARLPGRRIEYFEAVDSTMRAAAACPPGTAVVAGAQTAGIGRHGHAWHSEPDAGLYVSVVLTAGEAPPAVTLALGLAAADAIARATGIACDLRWPNDLMLGDRKVGGILVQLAGAAAIAGIGVNVNHTSFPPELAREATSLRMHAGREFSREEILACLLPSVDAFTKMLWEDGKDAILDLFSRASSYASGRRVTVEGIAGTTAGLDPLGFLRVRKDDGTITVILAGGVRATGA